MCRRFLGLLLDILVFVPTLVGLPLVLLLLLPLYLWRLTVKVLARLLKPNELGPMLSPTDATFFPFESPETHRSPDLHLNPDSMVCVVFIFKGTVDVEAFRDRWVQDILEARDAHGGPNHGYDRFRQHVASWLGYPFFRWDADFDISDHIRLLEEPVTEETLPGFVGARLNGPWHKGTSMWETVLVHGYNGENKTLCAFRLNHALADGQSLLQMIKLRMLPEEEARRYRDISSPVRPTKSVPLSGRLKNLYYSTLGLPRLFLQEMAEVGRNGYMVERKTVVADDTNQRWISWSHRIPVADLKRIKAEAGISFSEAMNTAISAAVGNYVKKCLGVEDKTWIPGGTIFPAPDRPAEGLTNVFGIAGLAISLDKDVNSVSGRLDVTRATFRHAVSPAMQLNYALQIGIKSLPLPILQRIPPPNIAFLYANVPGPAEPMIMWDNELVELLYWLKARKTSPLIMFSIVSYRGTVRIGVTACSSFVRSERELDRIMRDLEEELAHMMKLKGTMWQMSSP